MGFSFIWLVCAYASSFLAYLFRFLLFVVWFGTGQRDWLGKSVSEIRDLLYRLVSQSVDQ